MNETHLDLAHVQDWDEVRVLVWQLVRRHFVKVLVSLEVPHAINAERMPHVGLGVDDTSRPRPHVFLCLYSFLRNHTSRPKVILTRLVGSPTDFHRLLARQHELQPLRFENQNAIARSWV